MPDEYQNRLTFSAYSQLLRFLNILVFPVITDDEMVIEATAEGSVYQVSLGQDAIVANEDYMRAGTYLIVLCPQLRDSGNF